MTSQSLHKQSVLFLCTGNSCRSQMAEGWCRHLHGDIFNVYSAGIEAHGLNPHAVAVMAEAGIDIRAQESQLISAFGGISIETVITVCGHAHENCPALPFVNQARIIHHGFEDPPKLAAQASSPQDALDCYRIVCAEVRSYIEALPDVLGVQAVTSMRQTMANQ